MEQLSSMRLEAAMRRAILVPGKHDTSYLILLITEEEIEAEPIPLHMYQGKTTTTQPKEKGGKTIVMAHARHINETTTLYITTEEEWSQATSEYHDLRYIKRILFGLEETLIDTK